MKKLIALTLSLLALLMLVSCTPAESGGNGDLPNAYTFKTKGVTLKIDADLEPIIEELGDWIYYDEAPSCAHEGKSKYYTYAGIDIESYPKDGKDLIYMIALIDDTVSTVEGIRVGDSKDDVIEKYGEPSNDSKQNLLYPAKGMYLNFIMSANGKTVSQIQYMHPDAIDG